MELSVKWSVLAVLLATLQATASVELTFELLDNAKDCFFEYINKNTTAALEFQVKHLFHTLIRSNESS